jgi:hypothetical protein
MRFFAHLPARRAILGLLSLACITSGAACGGAPTEVDNSGDSPMLNVAQPSSSPSGESTGSCGEPSEGCPCSQAGESATCHGPTMHDGSYTYCLTGYRVCSGQSWGPCTLPKVH